MSWLESELREQPQALAQLLERQGERAREIAGIFGREDVRYVVIASRGSSSNAARYAQYLLGRAHRVPVMFATPSLYTIYEQPPRLDGAVVLGISQSGASPDVASVLAEARRQGRPTVALTNALDSPLAREADSVLLLEAGEERAVAATKTYVAQLAAVAALVGKLAPGPTLRAALPALPDELTAALDQATAWVDGPAGQELAGAMATAGRAIIASRGFNLATALEVSLKLKETSRVFAEGYSTADLEHGPIVLAAPDVPLLVVRPDGPMGLAIDDSIERAEAIGSRTWLIGGRELNGRADSLALGAAPEEALPEALTPLVYVLPGQLLAEAVALRLGRDPDAPSGLTKITRTR